MRSSPSARWAVPAAALLAVVLAAPSARAFVVSEDELEESATELGAVFRSSSLLLAGPTLSPPYSLRDESPSGNASFEVRSYFMYRSQRLRLVWHQTSTSNLRSSAALGGLALGKGHAPPRFLPLRVESVSDTLTLATSADWLFAAYQAGPMTLTLGRQPVTLGSGRLFHPWDLISSFALTEIDTEYKPGVDAIRLDYAPWSRATLSALSSGGELAQDSDFRLDRRGSSLALTFKQGWSHGEWSGLAGYVRDDLLLGYASTWTLSGLDLYAEGTLTWRRKRSLTAPTLAARQVAVPRALLGAVLKPAAHVTLIPELYYDGFGGRHPRDYTAVAFSERVAVGEQTTLGRAYAGAACDWQLHPLVHLSGLALMNALDPSALFSLSLSYDAAENTRLLAGGYVPFGSLPATSGGLSPQSEYGLYPTFAFAELRVTL